MKVHQNLVNLHNFTLKDRLKHDNKVTAFFPVKKAPHGTQSNARAVQNLKIARKRRSSVEDDPVQARKLKINPLRVRGDAKKHTLHARD